MNDINKSCKNCNYSVKAKYCENCGQRTSVNKVTFKETIQDFIDMVFSVNAPLMLTLKMLIVNPGKLFREYLEGKRKKYYKPVAFLILATIVFVLIKAMLKYDPMQGFVSAGVSDEKMMTLLQEAGVYMSKNSNNIVFIFVFTLSISLKLFFFKRYLLSEYVAISFYIIGFYTIITSILIFYLKFVGTQLNMIPLIILMIYILYAITSFFQTFNIWVLIKLIFAYMISLFLYMIFGFGLSFLIVWLKAL